jgi:hypothetical protein
MFLSVHPSLSIPDRDTFQLHLTPLNSTPTSLRTERPSSVFFAVGAVLSYLFLGEVVTFAMSGDGGDGGGAADDDDDDEMSEAVEADEGFEDDDDDDLGGD